jgi:DNA repair and recombination RAD54-like protein
MVVLLDVEWNSAVERQAISRAYRLGQFKDDRFIIRLLRIHRSEEEKSFCLEEEKYYRS